MTDTNDNIVERLREDIEQFTIHGGDHFTWEHPYILENLKEAADLIQKQTQQFQDCVFDLGMKDDLIEQLQRQLQETTDNAISQGAKLGDRIAELEAAATAALTELTGLTLDPWKAAEILKAALEDKDER